MAALRLLGSVAFMYFIAASELLDSTGGIDELLLPGKEWMAVRTDFQFQVTNGGTNLEGVSTGAGDGSNFVLGMNTRFQDELSFYDLF